MERKRTTKNDIEGPFYMAGAPDRQNILPAGAEGEALLLTGRTLLLLPDDRLILASGIELDFWQADKDGVYDNQNFADPHKAPPGHPYHYRGKQVTDENGNYRLETIKPGHYPISDHEFRTSHIHVKARKNGKELLTTQLYFPGDPFNAADHWYSQLLEITDKEVSDNGVIRLIGSFDFILQAA